MDARPFELNDLFDVRHVSNCSLSPDGERIAFVLREADRAADENHRSLFVVPTDGDDDPHRLTRVSGVESPKWSPDGSKLAFLAARERDVSLRVGRDDDAEDEGDADDLDDAPNSQVWLFDLGRGGDARQITDRDEGVREFDWGPDGERLVVSARDPTDEEAEYLNARRNEDAPVETERLQHKYDGTGFLDEVTTYLFVVDVRTRAIRRLDDAYGGGAYEAMTGLQPAWGPDRIAFISNRTEHPDRTSMMDVFTIDPSGSDLRRVTDGELSASKPRWSPDGGRLSFVGGNPNNWCIPNRVFVADGGTYQSVSTSLDRSVLRVGAPTWTDDDTLLAPFGDEARTRLVRLAASRDDPERVFETQDEYRTITSFDATESTVALCLTGPSEPTDVYAMPTDAIGGGEAPTRLTAMNADLVDEVAMPNCRRVTFENGDGGTIEAIAYLPPTFDPDDPEPHPLIAAIHGGPMSYDAPQFGVDDCYWTGKEYIVLRVNYRGSISYGREFTESIRGEWGPRESDDIISGVEWAVRRGWADEDRLFVTGFSQGGVNSAHVITQTDLFAAAAPEHGIYDFYSLFGTGDHHQWYVTDLGLPWEEPDAYHAMSSITEVGDVETPTLVTAGENDWRCPPSQAEQLYVSLKRQGVPTKLVIYPNEHHNIGAPKRTRHRLETLTEWFERHDPESK
ncbi:MULTISPECIES: S9 family peptidase [unclassified Haladaptatus]|uniref:alpha/beta hydrolase family protein n=1 Tax=unclassified Haladaptatus TaxID=2622732 RepID=UPI00209C23C9|nr:MULTISPECIES: S9 family peptidase [unclassified Haladaptatus]MCO8244464.1 S9 family peptidase [Haladaptatus sp. AB643]MCO8253914.1 S9 family peptidase [Haladaptatus sp. AB618]